MIQHKTIDWGYHAHGDNRTSYSASILSRDGRCIIWTTGCTTTRAALCDPYSRSAVFDTLRRRVKTLRPGRRIAVHRIVHR